MPSPYVPTGQPRHKQAPGPKPETLALIARVRAALDAGVRRMNLAGELGETPGRVAMAMDYISRWDGGTPTQKAGDLPRPQGWGWQEAASCKGMDLVLFFGPEGERQPERARRERKAKRVCAGCPVRGDCLSYAVGRPERAGIYGGLNEEERTKERRKQLREACDQKRAAS